MVGERPGDRCASAWLELSRQGAGGDPVRVDIGSVAFVHLTDALFDPEQSRGPIPPIALSGRASTAVDGKARVDHGITEQVDGAGVVTVTVEGDGGLIVDLSMDEPAVAAYLHRKAGIVTSIGRGDYSGKAPAVDSPAARRKIEDGWIPCPMPHYPADRCSEALCDAFGLVHPAVVTARLGPWITAEAVRAELDRIRSAWDPELVEHPYWEDARTALLAGTSEACRVEGVEVRLMGLGWGKRYTQPGSLPDGPTIDLWLTNATHHAPADPDHAVEWCPSLGDGRPVRGGADTVAEALDLAAASITRQVAAKTSPTA